MAGREVSVTTNCFAVTRLPTKEYYQYDVIFPETKIFRKRQEVMQRLQNKVAPNVFSPKALYDGNAILYASHRLRLPGGGSGAYLVDLSDVQRTVPVDENTRGVVKVVLTRTSGATIRPSDIKALMSDRRITAKTATALNLLQLIIKQATNEKFPHNPRAFFSDSGKKMIPGGLELWRGFFQSVRPTLDQILVNIDTSITAMYQSGPVIDVALAFLGERDVRALALRENDVRFHELERFLKGLLIYVDHLGRRTKVIRGLVYKGGSYQFDKDGRTLTVAEHFRSAHRLQTRFPDAIGILLSGKNAPRANVVPVEFCKIQPGQLYKKKLPNHLTSEMVSFATIAPGDRLRAIQTSGDGRSLASPIMGYGASEYVVESGMQISSSPLAVRGKILNTPEVHMAMSVQPRDGAWNMRDQRVRQAATLEVWGVINFIPNYPEAQAQRHAQDLHRQMTKIGMTVNPPTAFINGNGQNVRASLNSLMGQIHSICGHSAQLLVVLFPNKGDIIRNEVKRWGDVEHGILTQHMKGDKLQRANDQYFANVAIKINARFGGINHIVRSPAFTSLSRKPFMIMGADVSHSSPGALRPSIASLVWSQDADATKYVAYTSVQSPRTEMIAELTLMVKRAILKFGTKNPVPENILFYRDGLSEGEIDAVGRREVAAVQQAIDEIWKEKGIDARRQAKPKVTFLIVAKRHHMLFFGDRNSQDVDRTGNLKAGFVTTHGVSSPLFNDFYLQSHAAIKGTARSGHYIVLRDDIFGNNQDMIQECSFALCHTYAKATRSVSIPTPVYYAHVVCTRAAFHFATDLRFDSDDGASNHSGDIFDLDAWQKHWKNVNPKINTSMYFL